MKATGVRKACPTFCRIASRSNCASRLGEVQNYELRQAVTPLHHRDRRYVSDEAGKMSAWAALYHSRVRADMPCPSDRMAFLLPMPPNHSTSSRQLKVEALEP